jgi:hypothetical protein
MDSARLRRAAIALVAAYAMALQALLMAVAPAFVASADTLATLCPGDGSGGHPIQHEWPCASACVASGQAISGVLPPDTTVAIAIPLAVIALATPGQWIAPVAIKGPQVPRGPPQA